MDKQEKNMSKASIIPEGSQDPARRQEVSAGSVSLIRNDEAQSLRGKGYRRDITKVADALRENLKRRKAQKNNQPSKGKQDESTSQKDS